MALIGWKTTDIKLLTRKGVIARMFRGLLPPPPTTSSAYIDLLRKVDEHARKPRVQSVYRICPHAALARVGILEERVRASLDMYERWAMDPDHPSSEIRRRWHRSRVDEAMVEVRRLIHAIKIRQVVRLIATVRIQRTMLKLLYRPRQGQLPKISRSLLDDGLVGVGEFGTTVDNGDGDDDG